MLRSSWRGSRPYFLASAAVSVTRDAPASSVLIASRSTSAWTWRAFLSCLPGESSDDDLMTTYRSGRGATARG